ncbi:PIR Superfamily Protein [Plasmodium ovale wallikeri]|uniref:PIR Superfamily Protein n=2 Tax=Plasmodium ovale TaxID=36330 RepID=A0A1A8YZR9_PLAOA|nr:PIR Superfamily Protein [Plasmodium ovale wallikeri]SBT37209.1 PIR Superfamily Protein [Plasmodium ovale wallikeri]SBT73527.1 PIR protein [Plasmodium ovale]
MDAFFDGWDNKYPLFVNSGLYSLYKLSFSRYYETEDYNFACNNYIENNFPESKDIRAVCLTAELTLKNLNDNIVQHEIDNLHKGCEYIRYWVWDKIRNINASEENIGNLYSALDAIKSSNDINDSNCNLNNFEIEKEEFEKKKHLYFHREILQWIKKKYGTTYVDNPSYENYLNDCATKYKTIVESVDCNKFESYKQELIDFKNAFEETTKFLLEKSEITLTNSFNLSDIPTCPSTPIDLKLQNADDGGFDSAQNMKPEGAYSMDDDTAADSHSTGNGVAGGIISSITFGMLFLFFISYKFTPFGQKLNQLKRIPKKMFNKIEDENEEFPLQRAYNDYVEFNNDTYNIQYNSI